MVQTVLLNLQTFIVDALANDLVLHGLRIALIVVAVVLMQRFAHYAIERAIRRAITAADFATVEAERKREDTLIRIVDGTVRVIAWFIAAFFLLTELGVSTTPFVTAAGVLGLAVSIGGQHVTRDIIAGACITIEDQFRVGDTVRVNGITGVVTDITLRMTVLRDAERIVHYIPNGTITTVANLRETQPIASVNAPPTPTRASVAS